MKTIRIISMLVISLALTLSNFNAACACASRLGWVRLQQPGFG